MVARRALPANLGMAAWPGWRGIWLASGMIRPAFALYDMDNRAPPFPKMRLTKLKLAGFKSFVDPTSVALPGQLVGVVGPNGCGKSNIMDAVRWVLGESKASELRGESMQDVIFNGSTNRKPVSRASVELIFDNSMGRAMGQWSQYAELSVKRLLTRNGQSDYFINNLKVRRKDITDLFLGTGLGPRAYAIIGQGMISRIIEAKPDDLRVFLEEAAGVSRYKERRKETEGRLADTRENLTRVEDIRLELASQMERLEVQAEVARKYHAFNDQLVMKQQLLWLVKRNEAEAERQRVALEVARATTELEGHSATLRDTESRLETAREAHFAAGDGLHQAQSDMYAANAEVARLEAEIRHRKESQRQLESRLGQLEGELAHWSEMAEKLATDREHWEELRELSAMRVEQAETKLEMQQESSPEAEARYAQVQEELAVLKERLGRGEQLLQVELTHKSHAQRSLQAIALRRDKLREEIAALTPPDDGELAEKEEELAMFREELAMEEQNLADLQQALPQLEQARQTAQNEMQQASREVAGAEARRAALEQMQARVQQSGKLPEWLKRHGLEGASPFWKHIQVEAGWEVAVESVLRERLNAVPLADAERMNAWLNDRPGAKVSVVLPASGASQSVSESASGGLATKVRCDRLDLAGALLEWLHGAVPATDLGEALKRRGELAAGQVLVTRDGDLITASSLTFFAPDKAEHGLLERQREIDELVAGLAERHAQVAVAQERLSEIEGQLADKQGALQQARRGVADWQQRIHNLQMETLRLAQAVERFEDEKQRLVEQQTDLAEEEEGEREREMSADEKIEGIREGINKIHVLMSSTRTRQEEAEQEVREARERQQAVERELREAQFSHKECESKLQDIFGQLATAQRQLQRIEADQAECQRLAEDRPAEVLEEQLQAALTDRQDKEHALTACRDALEEATNTLRTLEEIRLKGEQALEPLRTRIGELKLKEQAAALNAEQLAEQLLEAGADEAALAPEIGNARPSVLQGEITRLQHAITDLGPVNLAALQELETAKERKGYLDSQAADLTEAMETLENAIRRIDKETRDLLQHTFDTVNSHFGQLFPELFGGGRAELVMTGEEILDAGVQVIAQPPGKKNSTIHLLSGGEKALTAIALVFSMFQLNPAPFCLLDEVDAPLDDTNTERFCGMVQKMSGQTQFLFISHNKIAMEMAEQLVGVTMQESGVSRVVEVDIEEALKMRDAA